MSKYFERKTRDDGTKFWTVRDDAPEWVTDAVREAHCSGADLPNDWIYEECADAFEAIECGDIADDDSIHEYADGRVDVYTRNLANWYAEFCLSDTLAQAESEVEDCGGYGDADVNKRIAMAQYFAIARIARVIFEACQENDEASE